MTKRTSSFTCLTITVLILSISSPANAKTIYVDAGATGVNNRPSRAGLQSGVQYPSIQAAIDAAVDGDTIILAPGAFRGEGNRDIDFLGKAITVRSTDPNDPDIVAATIIDCNGTEAEPHRGFYFNSGEDANSVLSGFTIINGHADYGGGVYCKDSSPTLMDCIFSGNSAGARGGGMYNRHSDLKLTNCTFSGNSTNYGGGGMYNYRGDPTLTDCTFSGNSANFGGGMGNYSNGSTITNCMFINNTADDGGGIWNDAGSPEITNCIFYRNSVTGCGGGLFDEDYGHAILANCIFIENFARGKGGAIHIYDSPPILTNCTISGNFAGGKGGGIFNDHSIAAVTNSILWGNEDEGGMDESAQIHISAGAPIVNYTCIQGLTGNLGGIGNIDADPCFVSPGYWDDWHPPYGISGWIDSDYHLKSQAGRWDPNTETWVPDDVTSPCIDAGDPMSPIGHEPFPNGGIINIGAYAGTAEAGKSYSGNPPCQTLYVNTGATGANDGSSWADAYEYLQDALADANALPKPVEIRVAQGVYTPDSNSAVPEGTGDREATFHLINGVRLKGGHAGLGEPDPNARDVEEYETILSGDLDVNDTDVEYIYTLWSEPTRSENCYHVVTGSGTDRTAALDSFTITGGHGTLEGHDIGAGMYNKNGSPTLIDCTFRRNVATNFGGGMYNSGGDPILTNCHFIQNYGDGMWNSGNPTLSRCTFRYNRSDRARGAGMGNSGSPILTDCIFIGNTVCNDSINDGGGGMYNHQGSAILINCIFAGNLAGGKGGAMWNWAGNTTLTNCTFVGNSAPNGSTIACYSQDYPTPATLQFANCILWDGENAIWNDNDSTITIDYSDVEAGWTGEGNIDADPCFVEFGHWEDPNDTPDFGLDDIWVDGDYHLKSQGGRYDPNTQSWVYDDVTSPCIDAADPMSPIGYEPFPNGGIVNMGAYGGTAEAGKSYFGQPPCETIVAGDINGDCEVNFLDFRLMALHWMEER